MNISASMKTVDNGVNVEALLGARTALAEMPEAAEFTWRANCEWMGGVHSRSTVEGFFGLGEEKAHRQPFVFEASPLASPRWRRIVESSCARSGPRLKAT